MRVLVLGGTRFIGRALVAELLGAGHEVALVHRGSHEPEGLDGVEHFHAERERIASRRRELAAWRPDAALDMAAMTAAEAEAALTVLDGSTRLVVASSCDVYRAFDSVYVGTITDPVPLAEDAPLRQGPQPDLGAVPPGWDFDPALYEKLEVERAYLERGATVCRLPMVYGERDYMRREEFVLRRVRAGRSRIPVGPGTFLWSRGHAAELARGLRLAAERDAGGAFNLAEPSCAPIRLWAEEILRAAEHEAELVRVPESVLPKDLALTGTIPQPLMVDPSRAAAELDWTHGPWRQCVARSVRWHLANPPPDAGQGFAADERALAAAEVAQ